jgi:hypothetical protein
MYKTFPNLHSIHWKIKKISLNFSGHFLTFQDISGQFSGQIISDSYFLFAEERGYHK